ncbi:hypothetical protein ACIP6X_02405 [Streptomyces coeruleorubidus]|uniref:hypothetical protein n=1 Tax=Streptomyces coeruleorubidus TaxID=116188 RepID=UPI003826C312
MTEPSLTLFSRCLLSKWGFNDGEAPDQWFDYCDNLGVDWTKLEYPLTALVRHCLLPVIEQDVTVVEIETSHNPIRVEKISGQDVTEVWYGRAPEPTLTPDAVDVPMAQVLRLAIAEAGLTEVPRYTPPLSSP